MLYLVILWFAVAIYYEFFGHIKLGYDKHEVHNGLRVVIACLYATRITIVVGLIAVIIKYI